MNLQGCKTLARATFALKQYSAVCRGDHGDHLLHLFHARALTDDFSMSGLLFKMLLENNVFHGQPAISQHPVDKSNELCRSKGFGDKVKGAQLDGLDSCFNGAVPCDHNDDRLGIEVLNPGQDE